jgi:hypothetical protein
MRRLVFAVILLALAAVPAAAQPGTPVTSGQASFKYGAADIVFDKASGSIMQSSGFVVATVTFAKPDKPNGDHLTISVMIQGPGAVDLNQAMGNGIGYWIGGKILQYEKGKSQCTLTVTKVSATMIEGTADCPLIHEMKGGPAGALTNVKFSASTK